MAVEKPKRQGIQLAYPATENAVRRLGKVFYIQPKLNGERCKVIDFHDEPVLLSSYGNEFKFMDHIQREIKDLWRAAGTPFPLDGEIYVHGWERERIDSALRRRVNQSEETKHLEFHVFDVPIPVVQEARLAILSEHLHETEHIKRVDTYLAEEQNWLEFTDRFLDLGYEGSIVRSLKHLYQEKRTNQMLKYKPTEYDEYEIVDLLEAISKDGDPKGMVGAFIVRGNDGTVFKVGAGKLTHSRRTNYWNSRKHIIGMTLLVKHGKIITSNGIPTPAVAVEVV